MSSSLSATGEPPSASAAVQALYLYLQQIRNEPLPNNVTQREASIVQDIVKEFNDLPSKFFFNIYFVINF